MAAGWAGRYETISQTDDKEPVTATGGMSEDQRRLVIVMGVSGCGKSTIAEGVAAAIGGRFFDGDPFHPQANTDKMSRGEALTDDDRWPWLTLVGQELARGEGDVVGACSALKLSYRQHITRMADAEVRFVHLNGTKQLIADRMAARDGHFMPLSLLESQFAALEPPAGERGAVTVDISPDTGAVIAAAARSLGP